MKKFAWAFAALILLLPCAGTANAATGTELIDAVRSIVGAGLSNADTNFSSLRGASVKTPPGEHYQVTSSFGEFFPNCHISGYQPPVSVPAEWVLSCSSPGLGAANPKQLLGLIYEGAVRALPACFTRTLNPALLRDENFRWDCRQTDRSLSVDVSTTPTSNGDPSILLEVYVYPRAPQPQLPTPAPSATPIAIHMAKPQDALTIAGVNVPYADYATLNLMMHTAAVKGVPGVVPRAVETLKGGNEMPAYDWVWHYAGKQTTNGQQTISVWVCANLSPTEQTAALDQATLLGLLDSGLGGRVLQKAYAAARDADAALGAQAEDPFANRRKLIYAMAPYFQ